MDEEITGARGATSKTKATEGGSQCAGAARQAGDTGPLRPGPRGDRRASVRGAAWRGARGLVSASAHHNYRHARVYLPRWRGLDSRGLFVIFVRFDSELARRHGVAGSEFLRGPDARAVWTAAYRSVRQFDAVLSGRRTTRH